MFGGFITRIELGDESTLGSYGLVITGIVTGVGTNGLVAFGVSDV